MHAVLRMHASLTNTTQRTANPDESGLSPQLHPEFTKGQKRHTQIKKVNHWYLILRVSLLAI
jgi:hypothetical protein